MLSNFGLYGQDRTVNRGPEFGPGQVSFSFFQLKLGLLQLKLGLVQVGLAGAGQELGQVGLNGGYLGFGCGQIGCGRLLAQAFQLVLRFFYGLEGFLQIGRRGWFGRDLVGGLGRIIVDGRFLQGHGLLR